MTRDEFVKIVNDVAKAEENRVVADIKRIQEDTTIDKIPAMLAEIILQIPSTSARCAAQIIENSGLIQFDD